MKQTSTGAATAKRGELLVAIINTPRDLANS